MAMSKSENKKAAETARGSASSAEHCAAGSRNAIRILVAEDHTIVRDGLIAVIKQGPDMTVVADAGDGQRAPSGCDPHGLADAWF
jgi:hypothetical protein